jgi:hypothetical protein
MNVSEITAKLYEIGRALLEKTGEKPWVAPQLVIVDGACSIDLMKDYGLGGRDYMLGVAKGETPEAAIADAFAIIGSMASREDAKLRNHMKRVASCIDKGREDGIDDAYIAPLVVVKNAMTENLLAKE